MSGAMGLATYAQFLGALVFVLALIGIGALLLRRFAPSQLGGLGGRDRRLAISEVLALDARRRLVLVRRDDREHLILLGVNGETVIESAIPVAPTGPALERDRLPSAAITVPAERPIISDPR